MRPLLILASLSLAGSAVGEAPADLASLGITARCATPALSEESGWPQREEVLAGVAAWRAERALPKDGHKMERDAFGGLPNVLTSENFALKWGDIGGLTEAEVSPLLELFEDSWAHEVEERGYPLPPGSDATLFNVYIGDTGDGAPESLGAGGYFYVDPEGWPMIVINRASVTGPGLPESTVAHEFFHAVQVATGNFPYEGVSAWYVEATAEWMSGQVFPGHPYFGVFLYGYALLPHLPLYHFEYAASGTIEELHQYGAFIFPLFLEEHYADADLIRDSWLHTSGVQDPLLVLDELLVSYGEDKSVAAAFAEMTARNVTWDYEDGPALSSLLEAYAPQYPDDDHRVVFTVPPEGTEGWVDAPAPTRPNRYGANVVAMPVVEPPVIVEFGGSATGSEGSAARWRVGVVTSSPAATRWLDLEDHAGALLVEEADSLHVVVASVPDSAEDQESFSWGMAVYEPDPDPDPEPEPEPEVDGGVAPDPEDGGPRGDASPDPLPGLVGCACQQPGRSAGFGLAAVLLGGVVLSARRRRSGGG